MLRLSAHAPFEAVMPPHQTLPRSNFAAKLRDFPDHAASDAAAFAHRGHWSAFFAGRVGASFGGRIILDIGCFDAAFLADIAAEHPRTAFVGIDWKCKAIYDGARNICGRGLRNIFLLRARATDLLQLFARAELDEIWIFHPDPCAREAERKHRLVSAPFLLDAHAVLKNDASVLALKTDREDYYQSSLQLFDGKVQEKTVRQRLMIVATSTDYWHDAAALAHTQGRLFAKRRTLFESRFHGAKKPIFYIECQKRKKSIPTHEIQVCRSLDWD